jgi:hypothetical protein
MLLHQKKKFKLKDLSALSNLKMFGTWTKPGLSAHNSIKQILSFLNYLAVQENF